MMRMLAVRQAAEAVAFGGSGGKAARHERPRQGEQGDHRENGAAALHFRKLHYHMLRDGGEYRFLLGLPSKARRC